MTAGQPPKPARFELAVRALSAVVMALAAVSGLLLGGWVFATVFAVVCGACLLEWHRLVNAGEIAPETLATGLSIVALAIGVRSSDDAKLAAAVIAAGGLAAAAVALRSLPRLWPAPWHAFAAVYVGVPFASLLLVRNAPGGVLIVGAIFVAVWTTDTAALLVGRAIGGPKLARVLSPNKTWAGFLGGTLAASLAEALYSGIVAGNALAGLLLGLALSLASHAGDLFESWVKRRFHAKNMGHLIPGHGGMLDRVDSLLFAAPVCAILIVLGLNPFGGPP